MGYMLLLFERGTVSCTATAAETVAGCFGTAPVSGPSILVGTADEFGVTLPRMKGTLHLINKIST